MANDAVILVFAKAPVPGEVKTRMIPAIGSRGAAMLHAALTERALKTGIATGVDVMLCAAPDCKHAFFEACANDFGVSVTAQLPSADLGARMLHALDSALDSWRKAILVGADCPALTRMHLAAAIDQLSTNDVVLTPVDDGGYALIGARRTDAAMFMDIDWGTGSVVQQQRRALADARLSWHEMETLWDLDRPEDLARLIELEPPLELVWPP